MSDFSFLLFHDIKHVDVNLKMSFWQSKNKNMQMLDVWSQKQEEAPYDLRWQQLCKKT